MICGVFYVKKDHNLFRATPQSVGIKKVIFTSILFTHI